MCICVSKAYSESWNGMSSIDFTKLHERKERILESDRIGRVDLNALLRDQNGVLVVTPKQILVYAHANVRLLDRLVYAIEDDAAKSARQLVHHVHVSVGVRRSKVNVERLVFNIAQIELVRRRWCLIDAVRVRVCVRVVEQSDYLRSRP